jgi:hypothetical protein
VELMMTREQWLHTALGCAAISLFQLIVLTTIWWAIKE